MVVRDQDLADCVALKARLTELCVQAGRPDTVIRIACRELEAWYLADLAAVDQAFCTKLAREQQGRKYRQPDRLSGPSAELAARVRGFGKVDAARRLGGLVDVENTRSPSFAHFVAAVRRLTAECA